MVSKQLKIWRVETMNGGRGPYCSGTDSLEGMFTAHLELEHATPLHDGIYTMQETDYCGFVSREQLDKWFTGWEQQLADAGFAVAVYDVPLDKIKFGRTQVVFERGDSFPVAHMPIMV